MTTDYQAHWYPRTLLEAMRHRRDPPRIELTDGTYFSVQRPGPPGQQLSELFFDLDLQHEEMDGAGIAAQVVSPAVIGDVSQLDPSEARELAALVNEEYARAQREHPGRFYGLATLPMQDPDAAVEVLDDAIGRLGLCGVVLHSNVDGRPICSPETEPVWSRIAELGVPVVLHPTRSLMAPAFDRWGRLLDVMIGWLLDTSAAAVSLITSGTLDRYPELTVLHPHVGGTIPYLASRLDGVARMFPQLPELPSRYLKRHFYADSQTTTPGALQLAIALYGVDRVLFGSDGPYLPRASHVAFLRAELPAEQAETILASTLPLRRAPA